VADGCLIYTLFTTFEGELPTMNEGAVALRKKGAYQNATAPFLWFH